jgi:ssDNA-binding Zn-finger/Zn-ribbon topoisomerase 1
MSAQILIKIKCNKCGADFEMREEDFMFYESVGSTAQYYCPNCRSVKKSSPPEEERDPWRNPLK